MIRRLLKVIIPSPVRRTLRLGIKRVRYLKRRIVIGHAVRRGLPMKIIIGAAETSQGGWYSTQEQWLDVTKVTDWRKIFGGRKLLTKVVSEHVFEHLTEAECKAAFANIVAHLVGHGRVRIAVPDGYHPDPEYLRYVGIGGIGDDADDHKQLLNVDMLFSMMRDVGLVPELIEGYDRSGRLVTKRWSDEDGHIKRSRQNPRSGSEPFVDANTSLIVDGLKP